MNTLTVSQVNRIVKQDLENNPLLRSLQVTGEVSNFKNHSRGHFYFDLKDEESKISCVMWASYAQNVKFKIENGMKVTVTCSIATYVATGVYQLSCYSIDPIGVGDLYLQFEELKKKLHNEGLFDEYHKKKLPEYPMEIGVVSAKEGAAIQDVITTISRRWPLAQLTLIPSLVQGKLATNSLIKALNFADKQGFDEIIVARGGGSIEDLWCFNEEEVARTVYNMKTPVISAVGHEVDFTIIDYVSDLRAPTPTGAGELGTPNIVELIKKIEDYDETLRISFKKYIENKKVILENIKNNHYLARVEHLFADRYSKLQLIEQKLITTKNTLIASVKDRLKDYKHKITEYHNENLNNSKLNINKLAIALDTLSPLKTMSRGYGILSKDNKVITETKQLNLNDKLNIQMRDGNVDVTVNKINKGE